MHIRMYNQKQKRANNKDHYVNIVQLFYITSDDIFFAGEEHKLKSEMEKKKEKISVTQWRRIYEVGWWINFYKRAVWGGGRQVRVCPSS